MEIVGLTIGDTARLLGVSISTVRRFTEEGKLVCGRNEHGHRRYSQADVERFAKARNSRLVVAAKERER